jgi:hypothetical protein
VNITGLGHLSTDFLLLRAVNRNFVIACQRWASEDARRDLSQIGILIANRCQAQALVLSCLLEELVQIAVERDCPIPPEIDLTFAVLCEEDPRL